MLESIIIKNIIQSKNIGLGALFKDIYYYSKDTESCYLDCNEAVATDMSLISLSDVGGRSDSSFGWSKERINFLRKIDLETMKNKIPTCKLEKPFIAPSGRKIHLISYKTPLIIENKVVGIAGLSIDIISTNVFKGNMFDHFSLLRNKFSNREFQILFHLIRGKSAKEISEKLGLSKRTIEFYLTNIKNKAGVSSKSELIEKIVDGFI